MVDRLTGAAIVTYMIGTPVSQTVLPGQFNRWFQDHGTDAMMVPLDLAPGILPDFCASMRETKNCRGMVVTAPHKQAMLDLVDEASPRARLVGAVNIVVRSSNGKLIGDNIDGDGFLAALRHNGLDPSGKRALVFGCGGAGSAVAAILVQAGIANLDITDLDGTRASSLAKRLGPIVQIVDAETSLTNYDLIINATAIGLDGKSMVTKLNGVSPGTFVADIVTRSPLTPLLEKALKLDCRIQTGSDMARAQFLLAANRFGFDFPETA